MIEIFRTSVSKDHEAAVVMKTLHQQIPALKINFDLSDSDKILRVETQGNSMPKARIEAVVKTLGFTCQVFPD